MLSSSPSVIDETFSQSSSIIVMTSDYPFSIFTLLAIVLSVLLVMASDYPFSIFTLLAIVLSVLLVMTSDYQGVIRSHN
jgi:hypothetical protein